MFTNTDYRDDQEKDQPLQSNHSILIAEDNEANILVITALLKPFDCTLRIARDGKKALDLFSRENFDAIIMDIKMPIMGGLEAAQQIRRIEREQQLTPTPIIACTAHIKPVDQHLCIGAGMNDYLSKPLCRHALLSKLEIWAPAVAQTMRAEPRVA